jgi:head-tail adaptor
MNIGRLNDRVRVEQQLQVRDSRTNEVKVAWVLLAEIWADIADVLPTQDEAKMPGIDMSKRPAKLRTRFYGIITDKMRFIDLRTDRILTVVSGPAEVGREEAMDWMCHTFSTEGQGG